MITSINPTLPLPPSKQCEFVSDDTYTRCPNDATHTLPYNGDFYRYCPFHTGWYAGLLITGDILWSELLGGDGK